MVTQEKYCIPESDAGLSSGKSMLLDAGAQSGVGEGHVPKIRKPYTITKQRERWTEEEHKKFLEALKLYGRAWRKIEEHVGSKTAVQIRSHAQKFFFKVVRETNNSNASSTEPIEIPPPRPKRKPSHPYPRKLVLPSKKENPMEQRARSASPNSSLSEQENQSPTSVLSAADTLASAESTTPTGSLSPVSSADVNQTCLLAPEDNVAQDDVHVPQSAPIDRVSVKLELFPSVDTFEKPELPSKKVLKLFGKDVVIPSKPLELAMCLSKSQSSDMGEGVLQASPENSQPVDVAMGTAENSWDNQAYYYVDGSGNQVEKPTPLPWWVFFRGVAAPPYENAQDKECPREGSCAGSNSELVNAAGNPDNNSDAETQSAQCIPQSDRQNNCPEEPKSETKPALLDKRKSMESSSKGFVPYKRCFSERSIQSSTIDSDEEGGQRIRLCL